MAEKISKNRVKKINTVAQIVDKIKRAKSVVFVDYRGLNVAHTTNLRVQMRNAGIDYKVYKNNLVKLALKECGIAVPDEVLVSTLAVAFCYNDEVTAAKILADVALKTKKTQLKFGVLDGNYIDTAYVKTLSTIPSKEVLISKLMFLLKAPVQKFAIVLNEIAKKQA